MHYPRCYILGFSPSKHDPNYIINLDIGRTLISPTTSLIGESTLFTHIREWIHHQALLYGHAAILLVVGCDWTTVNFFVSVKDWGRQIGYTKGLLSRTWWWGYNRLGNNNLSCTGLVDKNLTTLSLTDKGHYLPPLQVLPCLWKHLHFGSTYACKLRQHFKI